MRKEGQRERRKAGEPKREEVEETWRAGGLLAHTGVSYAGVRCETGSRACLVRREHDGRGQAALKGAV
jgi:hypothetical protein